jgi:hypothetical protein
MARGWESKGVEEQQAEATAGRAASRRKQTPEEIAIQRRVDALKLSRSRILEQLAATQNAAYRKSLEAALIDLDTQIARLNGPSV